MSDNINDKFEAFLGEQESETKRFSSSVELARQWVEEPSVSYISALSATTQLLNAPSDGTIKAAKSLPDIPNKKEIILPHLRTQAAMRYINWNFTELCELYMEMCKHNTWHGTQIRINPEKAVEMLLPLSDCGKDLEALLPAAKRITSEALEMAMKEPPMGRSFCFLSGNPGAYDMISSERIKTYLDLHRSAIIYEAPLSGNDWMEVADKLLENGFNVRYVQVYNDADTSMKNLIEKSISDDTAMGGMQKVNSFIASYQAQQNRSSQIEKLYGDRIKYQGIDNRGNFPKMETLGHYWANATFNYNIDTTFFKNIINYVDSRISVVKCGSTKGDYRARAKTDKLTALKQELSFACDVLSLQSKQLGQSAPTTPWGVRGEVQTVSDPDRKPLLTAESTLLETVDIDNNPYVREEGEFTYVERQFDQHPSMQFTGESVIRDSEDVAGIFKKLETASVENSFAVYIPKGDKQAIVQHLASGSHNQTMVLCSFILHSAHKVDAERVYFVHNHPSGRLEASSHDINSWQNVKRGLEMFDIKMGPGIIINTKSGKYLTFTDDDYNRYDMPKGYKNPIQYNIHQFNTLSFSKEYKPEDMRAIRSSADVAQFISSHRLGDRDKIGYLILDNANKAVGNLYLSQTEINRENVKEIAKEMTDNTIRFGGSHIIAYGRFEKENGVSLESAIKECSGREIGLLDIIQQTDKAGGSYISFSDECMLKEEASAYKQSEPIGKVSNHEGTIHMDIDCKALSQVASDQEGKVRLYAVQDAGNIAIMDKVDDKKLIFEVSIDKYKAIEAKGELKMDRAFNILTRDSDKAIGCRVTESANEKRNEVKKKRSKGLGL